MLFFEYHTQIQQRQISAHKMAMSCGHTALSPRKLSDEIAISSPKHFQDMQCLSRIRACFPHFFCLLCIFLQKRTGVI